MTLLLPALVLLVVLFLIPVGYAFFLGFTNLRLVGPTAVNYNWTGLANLHQLGRDSVFPESVELTAIFVAGSVLGTVVLGLGAGDADAHRQRSAPHRSSAASPSSPG